MVHLGLSRKNRKFLVVSIYKSSTIGIYVLLLLVLLFVKNALGYKQTVIAIDIGHSQSNVGALSSRGCGEFDFNYAVGEMLIAQLHEAGYCNAFIINDAIKYPALKKRPAVARLAKASLLISIHHDSVQPRYLSVWKFNGKYQRYSDRYRGFSIFYSAKNQKSEESFRFSQLLGEFMVQRGFNPTHHHAERIKGEARELLDKEHGIYRFDELVILRKADMPAVLLECGIIVNRDEEFELGRSEYRKRIVSAMVDAIEAFLGPVPKGEHDP
jgi:N-acetylmuramoyl-L-alanine amidase